MEELADQVGVTAAYLRMIRTGARRPARPLAEALIAALDLSPEQVELPHAPPRRTRDDKMLDLLREILEVCRSIDSKMQSQK
jgi:transcriptional regulator with XRE-family HTH domain